MKTRVILCLFFLLAAFHATGQTSNRPWEDLYNSLMFHEEDEVDNLEEQYELLDELAAHPINLNTVTKEELEQLPFLNEEQIEEICKYVYFYKPVQTLEELAMIESLNYYQRVLLQNFLTIKPLEKKDTVPSLQRLLKNARHELVATAQIPFYEREGNRNGYLGNKYKHWLRYTLKATSHIKAGVIGAQDAGEPFFADKNKAGYDYYSAYLLLQDFGRLKKLVAGNYRMKIGMGLVLNNNFNLGKLATLSSLGQNYFALRGQTSRSSARRLQGVAATVALSKQLDLSAFLSYASIDATLNADTPTIATILTSGYHRTQSEMDRKNNATRFVAGTHLSYLHNGKHLGLTVMHTAYDKPLSPDIRQQYRRWYASGKSFWNLSTDYGYRHHRLQFQGETAMNGDGALATLNQLGLRLTANLSLTALQRFFSYKYHSPMGQSFSDGGQVQNESGLYVGANWQAARRWTVMAYTDYAYFPWPRYQVSKRSHSWDQVLQTVYQTDRFTFLGRYRLRLRQQDNTEKDGLANRTEQRIKLAATVRNGSWQSRTQADMSISRQQDHSFGWMLSEHVSRTWQWLDASGTLGYFHTQDYASRLYVYEQGLLYEFQFPMYYGHGLHGALQGRVRLAPRLLLIAKVSATHFFDRDYISSSYQRINHPTQTDLHLQLRWQF